GIPGVTVIELGEEARVLAPLPLNLLPGQAETAEVLDAWGIRTFGQLAALPPLGVAARLGEEGTHLQRLARGEAGRQLHAIADPLLFEEEMDLDYPVELLEPLSFLLSRLLNDLSARLASRALAANEVRLALTLENALAHTCKLSLPVPMRDPMAFLKLLQLELSARPPGAPILKIRLALGHVPPRTQQHGLFLPLSPEPEKLEITLARLSNLLGAGNVGTPELLDTHRPDSFRMNRFAAMAGPGAELSKDEEPLVLRRYRPRKYAQVLLRENRPAHVTSMQIQSKVVACAGPWRSSGDWWMREPWDQEEWDVALSDGALYRIHEDLRTSRWFVEGSYD
ncbi:MAG: nucleotidyltransferase/DNA polymerase involved in repair-like protein, partial [Bryobacterales bacterium]|nr:nucleotidyltransferase/DNA polymerase involved in repair-like protein [Bryobacterales bacterium]